MPAISTYSARLILNTALSLTALGVMVRASSAFKEIVFARAFGASAETDAFVLAGTYAMFLPTLLGAAVSTALIAALAGTDSSLRGKGLAAVSIWIAGSALVSSVLIYVLAPLAMSSLFGMQGNDLRNAVWYSRILAPMGVTVLLAAAMGALLNSSKQFYLVGIAAATTPLAILFAILFFAERWGIEAAAWGTVVGGVLELLVLGWRIYAQRDVLFPRDIRQSSTAAAAFWRAVAVLSFASVVAALSPMVEQFFLSRLETGSITYFNYASKVNSLVIGVFGTAFGVVIYPYLSDLAAQRDMRGLKRLSWRLAAVAVPITSLATFAVYLFSYDIVEILFARGRFTEAAVQNVGLIQQVFAFQLPFYVAGLIAMRVLNAAGASKFVLWIACGSLLANALFAWLFYESLGASGLALAAVLTSIAGLIGALFLIKPALARRA